MPFSLLSPNKRPTVFGWIVLVLLIIITFSFVKHIFRTSSSSQQTLSSARGAMDFYGGGLAYRGATEDAVFPSANTMAPMPPMAPAPEKIAEGDISMGSGGSAPTSLTQPRVIKTGNLTLRVKDVLESMEKIRATISSKEGFIENSSVYESGGPRYSSITIRIPVARFESTLDELKKLAVVVLQENVSGQDITAEFIDLEADIRNAKAEEASYLEILKRSGDIEDVLAVTQRLADVRGRIERLEGHKRYLSQRTDYSTITVSLTEEARIEVPARTWRPGEVIREAIRDLIDSLQTLVNGLIRLVVVLIGLVLPIVLVVGLGVWALWKIAKALLRRFRS